MRKIITSMMVSADGYVGGKYPSYNWHNWDKEMDAYMTELQLLSTRTFCCGNVLLAYRS